MATLTLTSAWTPAGQQDRKQSQATHPETAADAPTSQQPSQSAQDRELARKLRRALVTNKSLSTHAHNVIIVARDGVLTIKGRVRSERERNAIIVKATQIAGASNVKDEMIVQTPS